MTDFITVAIGLLIPFAGTTLGAAMVFSYEEKWRLFAPSYARFRIRCYDSGFSLVLLIPAINMTEMSGGIEWIPAVIGFLAGVAFCSFLTTLSRIYIEAPIYRRQKNISR